MANKKIGAFVGKFYPPHIGHLSVVDKALEDLDEVWIIISSNKIREKNIKNITNFAISSKKIKKWFKLHYKHEHKVKVKIFDESGFRPYPDDRDLWAEKFKKLFPKVNVKIADEGYRQYNNEYFPEYEFYTIDRDIIPIHSTQIRDDLKNNLENIIPEAKKYFENKLKKEEQK